MFVAKNGQSMKYLIRAVKYFIWFSIILTVTIAILAVLGVVEPDPQLMFKDGIKSVWQIAILFFVVALAYPLTGFRVMDAIIPGQYSDIRDRLLDYMESKGYDSKFGRAMKMFEDRVTFTRSAEGFKVEGLRKVIVRLISGLEYMFRNEN